MQSQALSRRGILKGLGASLALPWLEYTASAAANERRDPPRLICFYVPGAVARQNWFPTGAGKDFALPPTFQPAAKHRDQLTFIRGLQHFQGQIVGHYHPINYLTGHPVLSGPGFPNTISMDQVFATHFGNTYLPSLALSHSDGIGSKTLSRNHQGVDIPAIAQPADVFKRLFPPSDPGKRLALQTRLQQQRSVLDAVGENLSSLSKKLGHADRQRLNQYTDSVRDIESRLAKRELVLKTERQELDLSGVDLEQPPGHKASMQELIETMTDLIVLAFQTDMTRVVTYSLGGEGGPQYSEYQSWAQKAKYNHSQAHKLHHDSSRVGESAKPAIDTLAQRDAMLVRCLSRLMDKLQALAAHDGNLLDHTQILFGGMQSATHSGVDAPIVVAGGKKLGWKHGLHQIYWQPTNAEKRIGGDNNPEAKYPHTPNVSLSNLFLTMLQQAGCPVESFKESTGTLSELLV